MAVNTLPAFIACAKVGETLSARQAYDEPSLGTSIGLLCPVLFAIFGIVSTVSVTDIQFVQTEFLADL
jgi:hypothetical protein